MPKPFRGLYPVTPDLADTALLLKLVSAVLKARPALLQYRNKNADEALRRSQIARLLPLCRSAGVPLIVNDHPALVRELGADGVHLGREDCDVAGARAVIGPHALIGVSCYNEPARALAARQAGADYVAFGAMFASPTKPMARLAPMALLACAERTGLPCAAIGGITLARAPQLLAAGADLLAVVSDVFFAPDPEEQSLAYAALFSSPAGSVLS